MTTSKVAAIVVAAGSGRRMGGGVNKVLLPLLDQPILTRTLNVFDSHPMIGHIVMVVAPSEEDRIEREIISTRQWEKAIKIVRGGATRHASEWEGIKSLKDEIEGGIIDAILVHDGARPFATVEEIERVVKEVYQSGAAVPAMPVSDVELAGVSVAGELLEMPSSLWAVQTPQGFKASMLLAAHRQAAEDGFEGVDTAEVVERAGHRARVVLGSRQNFKITTPIDLMLAKLLLQNRRLDRARLQL